MKNTLDTITFIAKGHVCIFRPTEEYPYRELLQEDHNDIQVAFAKEAVAKLLIRDITFAPSIIKVLDGGIVLAEADIDRFASINANEIELGAIFSDISFEGHLDELQLWCGEEGEFSKITGLDVTKNTGEPLLITWKITIL